MEPLSEAQIAHFGEHSYVVVPGVLSAEQVAATRAAVARNLPPSALEGGGGEGASYSLDHGGAASAMLDPALAAIAVHPVVLGSVAQLLGCEELVLSAFVGYMKHGGAEGTSADYEGALPGREGAHMDYKTYQQVPTRNPHPSDRLAPASRACAWCRRRARASAGCSRLSHSTILTRSTAGSPSPPAPTPSLRSAPHTAASQASTAPATPTGE